MGDSADDFVDAVEDFVDDPVNLLNPAAAAGNAAVKGTEATVEAAENIARNAKERMAPRSGADGVPDPPRRPTQAELSDADVAAREAQRKRAAAAAGRGSTILTGPSGLGDEALPGQRKTLLGR